jgi:GTPase-associated system helical domain
MTDDLTEVLREAWMGTEQIPIERVSTIASATAESLKTPDMPSMVRLAFGDARGDLVASLIATFNADEPVVEVDQILRQQLLAVAILLSLFRETAGEHVDQAALMVKTLSFAGREPGHLQLQAAADKHLQWARDKSASLPTRPKTLGQSTAAKEALDQLATAEWAIYQRAIVELSNEIGKVRQALGRHVTWVEQLHEPVHEQLELLWWVTSGISASAKRPLKEIPPDGAAVIAGLDVAALAPGAPGPPSSLGLLRFALATAGVGTDDPTNLDASRSAIEEIVSAVPVPPAADVDLFPVFAHLTGVTELPVRPEVVLSLKLAEETLNESYLYKLMGLSEDQ